MSERFVLSLRFIIPLLAAILGFSFNILKAEDNFVTYDEVVTAAAATTPQNIDDSIEVMQRLFDGGNFPQVIELSQALLDNKFFQPIPPISKPDITDMMSSSEISRVENENNFMQAGRIARQLTREMLYFYHARSLYENYKLNNNNDQLFQSVDEFLRIGENLYGFSQQQYRAQAFYWAAKGYMLLGDYASAIKYFREVAKYEPTQELDVQTNLELADALTAQAEIVGDKGTDQPGRSPQDLPANPKEVLKTREELLKEAERELSKITTNSGRKDYFGDVEMRLIELRYKLHKYDDAERLANVFLSRATPGSKEYALVSYYRAMSVYSQGNINYAVSLFKQAIEENKESAYRARLYYGYGWCNAQLAKTAGPEQRMIYLTRAQTALSSAIELMPFDAERDSAILELTDVLLKNKEYEDAVKVVQEVLDVPATRIQANYYAGLALKNSGVLDAASRHFHTVLELSHAYGNNKYILETLNELASLESMRQSYAEALEYYRSARDEAIKQLQYDIVASASLGMATAQAELGYYDEAKREEAASRLLDSVIDMSAAARKGEPADIKTAATVIEFRARALDEWTKANSGNLDKALSILATLQGRLLPRLRKDELEYVQGRIYYLKAQNQRREKVIDFKTQLAEFDDVFANYNKAESIVQDALDANPRGDFSAQTRYLLGLIYTSYGSLKLELAALQKSRGMGASAPPLEKEGVESYRKAVAPLNLAVTAAEGNTSLRIDARELLGRTYLAIGKYSGSISKEFSQFEKGLDEFRILAGEPAISAEKRFEAIYNMAVAYSENNQKQQAYDVLKPYFGSNIRAVSLGGQMMLDLQQPRIAYQTLTYGIKEAMKSRHPDDDGIAAAMYEAYSLGIEQSDNIAETPVDREKVIKESSDGLFDLGKRYPGTTWASKGLLVLGTWLLKNNQWQLALEKAVQGIESLKGDIKAIDTVQAMYLLKGNALLEGGKEEHDQALYQDALRAFAQAERANTRTNLGNKQRARSIYEQGQALLALGREDEALRYYGRVFSLFYNQYEEADAARYAAAIIHEKNSNFALALQLYDDMFDKAKYLDDKLRVAGLIEREAE